MLKRFVTSIHACPSFGLIGDDLSSPNRDSTLATVGAETHHGLETATHKYILAHNQGMRNSC